MSVLFILNFLCIFFSCRISIKITYNTTSICIYNILQIFTRIVHSSQLLHQELLLNNCFFVFQTWWIWVHLGDQNAEPCPQRGEPPWWFHGPKSMESPSWVLQFSTEGPVNTRPWTVCRHTVKLYIIYFIRTDRNRFIEICIIYYSPKL